MIELLDNSDIDKIKVWSGLYFLSCNYRGGPKSENIEIFRIFSECIINKSLNFREEIAQRISTLSQTVDSNYLANYLHFLINENKEEVFSSIDSSEVKNLLPLYHTILSGVTLEQGIYALLLQFLKNESIENFQVKDFINDILRHCSIGFMLEEKNYDNLDKVSDHVQLLLGGQLTEDMLDALIDNGVYINTIDHSRNNYSHQLMQCWSNPALICYLHNRFGLDVWAPNEEGVRAQVYATSKFIEEETKIIISKCCFSDILNVGNMSLDDIIRKIHGIVEKDSVHIKLIEDFKEQKYGLQIKSYKQPIEKVYYNTALSDSEYLQQFDIAKEPLKLYRGHNFLTLCLLQKRNEALSVLLKKEAVQEYIEKEMPNFAYYMAKKCTNFMNLFKQHSYLLKVKDKDGNNIFNQLAKTYHIEALIEVLRLAPNGCERNNNQVGVLDYISKNENIEEENKILFTSLIENAMIKMRIENKPFVDRVEKKKFKI